MTAKELEPEDEFRIKGGSVFRFVKQIDFNLIPNKVYIIYGRCKELVLDNDKEVILKELSYEPVPDKFWEGSEELPY